MALQSITAIGSITLQASSSSVIFSSIPNSYRDLIFIVDGNVTGSLTTQLRFNSDGGSNYLHVSAASDNANNRYSVSGTTTFINAAPDFGTNTRFNQHYYIFDYAQTDKHKAVGVKHGLGDLSPNMVAARWASSAAINTIELSSSANAFAVGTRVSLYGRIA